MTEGQHYDKIIALLLLFGNRDPPGFYSVSSEISDLCEIPNLLLFFSYFASQNKEITSGNSFFDVCCVN